MLNLNAEAPGPTLTPSGIATGVHREGYPKASSSTGRETLPCDAVVGGTTSAGCADSVEAGGAAGRPILDVCEAGRADAHPYSSGSAARGLPERGWHRWRRLAS